MQYVASLFPKFRPHIGHITVWAGLVQVVATVESSSSTTCVIFYIKLLCYLETTFFEIIEQSLLIIRYTGRFTRKKTLR